MATSVTQQISDQITPLFEKLLNIQSSIGNKDPSIQIFEINRQEGDLSQIRNHLADLQQRINQIWQNQINSREAGEENLLQLAKSLTLCSDVLDNIEKNKNFAREIYTLQDQFKKILGQPSFDSEERKAFTNHLNEMSTVHWINTGNRYTLQEMLVTLKSIEAPNKRENRETKKTQDAAYDISLINDQLKEIQSAFTSDPTKDFEAVLTFYKQTKEHYLKEAFHTDAQNSLLAVEKVLNRAERIQAVEDVLKRAEKIMDSMIITQKQIEAQQEIPLLSLSSVSEALKGLKNAIEKVLDELKNNTSKLSSCIASVTTAFEQLKKNEPTLKNKLLEKTYQVLKDTGKFPVDKDIPSAMKGISIIHWQGNYQDKLNALNCIIQEAEAMTTIPFSLVEKESKRMIKLLAQAKNRVGASTSAYVPHTPALQPSKSNEKNPCDLDTIVFKPIQKLQQILTCLSAGSVTGLEDALCALVILESKGIEKSFTISSEKKSNIADRPCFHLYFIHKNENPQRRFQDNKYGNNAMAGVYPTSNVDRSRAFQRTIVELALEELKDAVSFAQPEDVIKDLLELLEKKIPLDTQDMPKESKNLAHTLFKIMYEKHYEKQKTNSFLISPNDPRFQGDFGRKAFSSTTKGIDSTIKIEAINSLCMKLKEAWKI